MAKSKNSATGSVRIIGGEWRSRRLTVLDQPGLRPTIDRVRETLFNWLMFDLASSRCLDLFAGSGVLGLECLSRGATHCTFVENNSKVLQALAANIEQLAVDAANFELIEKNAISYLQQFQNSQKFDLVFIDPPFGKGLLPQTIQTIENAGCLNDNAKIYIEYDSSEQVLAMPDNWQCIKQKKAGQSQLFLYQR